MYDSNQLYESLLPKLDALEKKRREILVKRKKALLNCGLMGVGVVVIALFLMQSVAPIAGFIFLGLGLFGSYYLYQHQVGRELSQFRYLFKQEVIRSIASTIEPTLSYAPYEGISKQHFNKIGHYSRSIDRYASEDYFQGQLGATNLYFAEIHAEYKTRHRNSNGHTKTRWHTLFKGVLFAADFHKNFNTWVTIRPDSEAGLFGWIGNKLQKFSSSHIRMESPEFEENFKVNTGDDQQCRYLLTPDMQERLLKLKRSHGSEVIVSFQNESVYITIPKTTNFFETSIHQSVLSVEQVDRVAQQVVYFLNIVEDLNLNTRIWTKE
ncbi:MAG: DUF3137 domain-containing protein [Akkermansiaceae bacterium]